MADNEFRSASLPSPNFGLDNSVNPDMLDSLTEEQVESLGYQIMGLFNQSTPAPQAPQAQKVLNTIDRGLEQVGGVDDLMPGSGDYNRLKQPRMPAPRQAGMGMAQAGSGKMPASASRQIRAVLQAREQQQPQLQPPAFQQFSAPFNQTQNQPMLYNPLNGGGQMSYQPQQAPYMAFDPRQGR